jgi:glyoxylase-like metal-dependent hydrolase (beta-lactamase superfamily II)
MPPSLTPGRPEQLTPHVTRLVAPNPGPLTGPGTNTYLIGDRELAVIDPGPNDPAHVAQILDLGAGRIRWILCTHTHNDHSPGAPTLRQKTGASLAGMTTPHTKEDFDPGFDRVLADDETLAVGDLTVRTVFTPGHASNHLCYLLEDAGMLFTGDHIMQGSTVVIAPPDGNMRKYLDSLRRLHQFDLKVLAPGHGHLIEDPDDEVERLIQHRLKREAKVRSTVMSASGGAGEGATLDDLTPVVYDDVPKTLYPMARRSLRAHLDKLVEDREVITDGTHYRFAGPNERQPP